MWHAVPPMVKYFGFMIVNFKIFQGWRITMEKESPKGHLRTYRDRIRSKSSPPSHNLKQTQNRTLSWISTLKMLNYILSNVLVMKDFEKSEEALTPWQCRHWDCLHRNHRIAPNFDALIELAVFSPPFAHPLWQWLLSSAQNQTIAQL